MKATGIVRKLDELGRVVIPKEIRKTHDIYDQTPLEIFVDENESIILRKYITHCSLCGEEHPEAALRQYKAALLCEACHSQVIT